MFAFDKPFTWLMILLIVLLIFGAGKLPEIGKALGKGIKEFKDETTNGMNNDTVTKTTTTTTVPPTPVGTVTSERVVSTQPVEVGVGSGEASVRRRIIKHPDGREEIIEEHVVQK